MVCKECGSASGDRAVPVHTPSCTKGRCGATWNPGVWPYTTRCVLVGAEKHGDRHYNDKGSSIPGEFITLDQELENRDG